MIAPQRRVINPGEAQEISAAAFDKLEIVGVVDETADVGVFVVDAKGQHVTVGNEPSRGCAKSGGVCDGNGHVAIGRWFRHRLLVAARGGPIAPQAKAAPQVRGGYRRCAAELSRAAFVERALAE